jgi:hypothetical protein
MFAFRSRRWLLAAVLVPALVGCATAPLQPVTDLRPDVLKQFGGRWEWASWRSTPAVLGDGPIVVRLVDRRLRFETGTTSGQLALFEGGERRVLRGEGVDKKSGRPFTFELRQYRSGAQPEAQASSLVQLVFADD